MAEAAVSFPGSVSEDNSTILRTHRQRELLIDQKPTTLESLTKHSKSGSVE